MQQNFGLFSGFFGLGSGFMQHIYEIDLLLISTILVIFRSYRCKNDHKERMFDFELLVACTVHTLLIELCKQIQISSNMYSKQVVYNSWLIFTQIVAQIEELHASTAKHA